MSKRKIEYRVLDNAFDWISDFEQARKLADEFRVEMLHRTARVICRLFMSG